MDRFAITKYYALGAGLLGFWVQGARDPIDPIAVAVMTLLLAILGAIIGAIRDTARTKRIQGKTDGAPPFGWLAAPLGLVAGLVWGVARATMLIEGPGAAEYISFSLPYMVFFGLVGLLIDCGRHIRAVDRYVAEHHAPVN